MEGDETDEESSHPMHEGQEISVASIASLLGDSGRGATITYTEEGGTIITTADGTVVQTQQSLEELQKQLQASEGGQNIVLVPPEQLPPGMAVLTAFCLYNVHLSVVSFHCRFCIAVNIFFDCLQLYTHHYNKPSMWIY